MPRYGKLRKGTAVTIFVTEPFSNALRVKAESAGATDAFPVMKMNLVRDYQTGVYDYNDMLCTFVALDAVNGLPAGASTKVSFSCQEWCGHVYSQVLFGASQVRVVRHSYFESEADGEQVLEWGPRSISADALMPWARSMAFPLMRPGGNVNIGLLTSLERQRAQHEQLRTQWAALGVGDTAAPVRTRVGELKARTRHVRCEDGSTRSFNVEDAPPYRILRWEASTGERAELLGSIRLKYWELNRPGGEEALRAIGLQPRPERTT
jgi:hypothetical protein